MAQRANLPFSLYARSSFFEKADADPEKRWRIAGIASIELEDQDEEVVLQDGIDWSYFMARGFINDNHDKTVDGIIGYPESVEKYKRGARLPDGTTAEAYLTWAEGYLLKKKPRAQSVWETGIALQGTPRQLGFSVEGKTRARTLDGRTVVRSIVRHLAVTHIPVNHRTRASLMLKSLARANDLVRKGAGRKQLARAWAAFEKALRDDGDEPLSTIIIDSPRRRQRGEDRITKAQAVELVAARHPGISEEMAQRVVNAIFAAGRRTAP